MTARLRLPDRRPSLSRQVNWLDPSTGTVTELHVCVGLDPASGRPMEVFASCVRRPQSTLSSMLAEACVLLSRDLQHGRPVPELATAFTRDHHGDACTPIGAVARVLAEVAAECAEGEGA